MKILIVEDYFVSRMLLCDLLKEVGSVIHVAVDGEEAVKMVQFAVDSGNHYDLIFLDILMPKMDGQSALRLIREMETNKKIPYNQASKIVMTTAQDDLPNVKEAYSSLCDGYLVKPINPVQLQQTLAKLGVLR